MPRELESVTEDEWINMIFPMVGQVVTSWAGAERSLSLLLSALAEYNEVHYEHGFPASLKAKLVVFSEATTGSIVLQPFRQECRELHTQFSALKENRHHVTHGIFGVKVRGTERVFVVKLANNKGDLLKSSARYFTKRALSDFGLSVMKLDIDAGNLMRRVLWALLPVSKTAGREPHIVAYPRS